MQLISYILILLATVEFNKQLIDWTFYNWVLNLNILEITNDNG